MCKFVEKCWKAQNLTFGGLWWPDLWPDTKIDLSVSFIIFYALSIAAYRASLRGPWAELEGSMKTPLAPQHDTENRPPARRGLSDVHHLLTYRIAQMLYGLIICLMNEWYRWCRWCRSIIQRYSKHLKVLKQRTCRIKEAKYDNSNLMWRKRQERSSKLGFG